MTSLYPSRICLGLDPGASGGIAVLVALRTGKQAIEASAMPNTEADLWRILQSVSTRWPDAEVFAVIEKVTGYVGGAGNTGSSMFKFGTNFGACKMGLAAAGISYEEITPGVWQRALGITSRKKTESKTDWKNRLKLKASQLYPREKVTLTTSDALLIATFCYRKCAGRL